MNDEASYITYHRANNPGAYRALMPVENFVPCAKTLKVLRQGPLGEPRGILVRLPFVIMMPTTKCNANLYKGMFAVMVNP